MNATHLPHKGDSPIPLLEKYLLCELYILEKGWKRSSLKNASEEAILLEKLEFHRFHKNCIFHRFW